MRSSRTALLALSFGATACAASPSFDAVVAPSPGQTPPAAEVATAQPAVKPPAPTTKAPQEAGVLSAPVRTRLTPRELSVWNDPAFQRQYEQSFLAETEIEPRRTAKELEQLQKILEYMDADRMDKALDLLEKYGGESATALFDFTLANLYIRQQRDDEALAALRVAVGKHPKYRRAWQNIGWIHFSRGEFEEALPALTKFLELGGNNAITFGMLGYAYDNLGRNLSAETAYRMAILLDPATVDLRRGLAISLFKQRRFADAVALFDSLLLEQPDNAKLWLAQGDAYIGMEKPMRAAENYEMADQLGGSTARSLNTLGDIYILEELFGLASDYYVRAFELDPSGNVDRALRSARELADRNAFPETRRMVERIEELAGGQLGPEARADLLRLRARIASDGGSTEEQARVLREIVTLDPRDGQALMMLGDLSRAEGDTALAQSYYEQAASIEAFEADAYVKHAQLLADEGKYAQAVPLLKRAQNLEYREHVQSFLERVQRAAENR